MATLTFMPPIPRHCCDRWLSVANASGEWVVATVYRRSSDDRVLPEPARETRHAGILPRPKCREVYAEFDQYLQSIKDELARTWELKTEISWDGTQLIRYKPGGFFLPHVDATDDHASERAVTLVAYLNDDFTGGETTFPTLEEQVAPVAGRVLTFPARTLHASNAIRAGQKVIFVSWAVTALQSPSRTLPPPA